MTRKIRSYLLFGAVCLICALLVWVWPGQASPETQQTPPENLSLSDEYCLGCHGQPGQSLTLPDGSVWELYVNPDEHNRSIHGSAGYACVQCHSTVGEYPHPAFAPANLRQATLELNQVCQRCHAHQYEQAMDSVHAQALKNGNPAAAVCSDCHTAHAVQDWVDEATGDTLPTARTRIPQTCAQCHSAIYEEYLTSVHGSALTEENNPDVPTCIDCHGVHNIEDPTTTEFRLSSPALCGDCHGDPARMTKYGISTEVVNTYVADFHGTTVTIFDKQSPDAETNKAVCYDCHGVHNILSADDPEKGLQAKENLLATCQKCHPNADENFPNAWLSHYIPSPEKYPVVYYVDLFYKLFIPTVLGGMAVLVALDFSRMMINQRRRAASRQIAEAQPIIAAPPETSQESAAQDTPVEVSLESAASELEVEPAESETAAPPEPTADEPMRIEPDTPDEPDTPPGPEEQPGKEANHDAN